MKVIAWNCRGLNNSAAVEALRTLVRRHQPEIVFLSETKVWDPSYMRDLRLEIGMLNCEAVFSEGQSGGVAVFWKDGIGVSFQTKSKFHVDLEVEDPDGVRWRLTGFYGHPTTAERHRTWSLLKTLGDESQLPWIVIGDFNEILHADEKEGGEVRREGQMQLFRDALLATELFDMGFFGNPFTWKGPGMRSRLDRGVATPTWLDLFPASRIDHLHPIHGDHTPLLLSVLRHPVLVRRCQKKRFFFNAHWILNDSSSLAVKEGWSRASTGRPMFQAVQKIRNTRFCLNDWQRENYGNRGREMDLIRARLDALMSLPISAASQLEQKTLSSKLDSLLNDDYAYWKQRAKVTWLKDGDRNTKYFHRKASNRRAKNKLQGLVDEHGVLQESADGMEKVILSYFSSMFHLAEIDLVHMRSTVDLLVPRVTPEMNRALCAEYSAQEIKEALFQMYPTKSPGPDGMPPVFFQHYWDVVGDDVVAAAQSFLHSGHLLKEVNFTHICLIPKVPNPTQVSDLRPIALCNVIYKICSKAIANRLKVIMDQLISPFQSAFIPGRLITDNTLIANEVSHYIHTDQSSAGYMSLKLDMSKAYDRMEWCFLEAVLVRLGFAASWVQLVMQCVSTVRYSFLINGNPKGLLSPSRGLRQGDPLSPYLFLLGAEVFSALLDQKAALGLLKGVQVCHGAPLIHHLLFADDSLLFGVASIDECTQIKSVLRDYELASGQEVNFQKSSVVFSKGVAMSRQYELAESLGVQITPKHDRYLGLPTYVGRSKTETFSYIQERLSQKLEGWQDKMLSGSGKDLLIRVVAQSLPSYSMSCFLLPKSFCASLQQKCAKFWWGGKADERKIHWMSWSKLCIAKEEGGMGFRDLYAHNLALLAKQGWRLLRYPNSIVAQLFRARYYPSGDFLRAPKSSPSSSCWQGIWEARSVLLRGLRWQVGNGLKIRIWEDPWIPRPTRFKPLFHQNSPLVRVHELMDASGWSSDLVTAVFDPLDAEVILPIPLSSRNVSDKIVWHFDPRGLFTTKSAYKVAMEMLSTYPSGSEGASVSSLWKAIWSAKVPGKVKVHIWKLCSSILPTVSQLRKKMVFIENGCSLCNDHDETLEHISRDCSFVQNTLSLCPALAGIFARGPVGSCQDWLSSCLESLSKQDFALLLYGIWAIWKEMNNRVWSNRFSLPCRVQLGFCHQLELFRSVQVVKQVRVPRQKFAWNPPRCGWLKANLDGAFHIHSSSGGLGCVIRDADGIVEGGFCMKIDNVTSPLVVEALAARSACQFAVDNSLTPIVFESDCEKLVLDINQKTEDGSGYGLVVEDICCLLSSLPGSSFKHVFRESNALADKVAKLALGSNLVLSWTGVFPSPISNLVASIV